MPAVRIDNDPPPAPPERPSLDDCCRSGCEDCVFTLYEEALECYRAELAAWEKRRADAKGSAGKKGRRPASPK
jgi:Oxidoreductase-like protein, N-terminal